MKHTFIFFLVVCGFIDLAFAQGSSFEKYIRSYKETKPAGYVNFNNVAKIRAPMTKAQATQFVYNGDSSKLTCISQNYNMATEKKGDLMQSTRLPDKSLLMNMGNYFVIINSSYECHDPEEMQTSSLLLTVISKNYTISDQIEVYRVSGDFLAVTGLFNPKNGRIFLAGFVTNEKSMDAVMYEVDSLGLKIEELLRTTEIKSDFARAEECLTNLDWEVAFSE